MRKYFLSVGVLLFLACTQAWAFPSYVRHGYSNCNSCHVSTSGGGVLTNYGRELSKEIMVMASGEKEHESLYGLVDLPSYLRIGGDIRWIQTYRETPKVKEGRSILMQADVEAAIVTSNVTVVASAGREEVRKGRETEDRFISRRHYLSVPIGQEFQARAGRFMKNFGLMVPDHAIVTKRGLNWDQGRETYNVEVNWLNERYHIALTGVMGRPDDEDQVQEKGVALTSSVFFDHRFKLGVSYFNGFKTDSSVARKVAGPWWILGFTEKSYLMSEVDFTWVDPGPTRGMVAYNKLGYEAIQGLELNLTYEYQKNDLEAAKASFQSLGLGFQIIPRPHWIFSGQWAKQQLPMLNDDTIDLAWLMVHFYL